MGKDVLQAVSEQVVTDETVEQMPAHEACSRSSFKQAESKGGSTGMAAVPQQVCTPPAVFDANSLRNTFPACMHIHIRCRGLYPCCCVCREVRTQVTCTACMHSPVRCPAATTAMICLKKLVFHRSKYAFKQM